MTKPSLQLCLRASTAAAMLLIASGCAQLPKTTSDITKHNSDYHPVILVSIDGFKPDYLHRNVTPNLNSLIANGVFTEAMRPSFPSITFPNHYTLVTGLRPDHHGIVGNTMEDPKIPGVKFSLNNKAAVLDHHWWDEAEPIWVTAEKNNIRTATMFWPGSEADIHGVRPSEFRPFDGKLSPDQRVDTMLNWLDKPLESRPGFLTLYFDDVDHAGHEFGPDTPQTTQSAAMVDQAIGRLLAGLQLRHIQANLIIVSDHGMAATSSERVINLSKVAPSYSYRLVTSGSYAGIEATAGQEDVLATSLLKPHDNMECWHKEDIPARYHYGHNARVPHFVCLAKVGWLIFNDMNADNRFNGGAHGYDNLSPEMQALFIGNGPAFKQGVVIPPFDNVDIYPLVMKLIGVAPLESDGNVSALINTLH